MDPLLRDINNNNCYSTMPQVGFDPPALSHACYEASALPPSHHGWIYKITYFNTKSGKSFGSLNWNKKNKANDHDNPHWKNNLQRKSMSQRKNNEHAEV